MANPVRVVAVLQAKEGMGGQVLAAWPALAEQVRAEQGCHAYDLHRVAGDGDRFVVLERWESVAALATHGGSDHMREFGARSPEFLAVPAQVLVLEDVPAA